METIWTIARRVVGVTSELSSSGQQVWSRLGDGPRHWCVSGLVTSRDALVGPPRPVLRQVDCNLNLDEEPVNRETGHANDCLCGVL